MLPLYQHIGYFTCTIKVNGTNSFTFPWICALESYFSSSSSKIPHYTTDQKEKVSINGTVKRNLTTRILNLKKCVH